MKTIKDGWWVGLVVCFLVTSHYPLATVFAGQLPSLFRGVVVTNSSLGVRVVSVDEESQAARADLRPDDIILRIHDQEVHSIDEFATLSTALRGWAEQITLMIFRDGTPHELKLHLYSYPILRAWGVEFVPDDNFRFAQPPLGLEYWSRLGRGFETAGRPNEALNAYFNALHNVPDDVSMATKVAALSSQIGQQRIHDGALSDGITHLRQALAIMQKLFDYPLTDAQLQTIRDQLRATVKALHEATTQAARKQ